MNHIKTKIKLIKCGESCKITNDLIKKLDQNIYTNYDYFLSGNTNRQLIICLLHRPFSKKMS